MTAQEEREKRLRTAFFMLTSEELDWLEHALELYMKNEHAWEEGTPPQSFKDFASLLGRVYQTRPDHWNAD